MIELLSVSSSSWYVGVLYDLLSERTPDQSISHKAMPTYDDHTRFVLSDPYLVWYLAAVRMQRRSAVVGAIYLSKQREIGVSIFRDQQRKGYARAAVLELMRLHPGNFLANVNPKNEASRKLWESLGFNLLQVTYEHAIHRS